MWRWRQRAPPLRRPRRSTRRHPHGTSAATTAPRPRSSPSIRRAEGSRGAPVVPVPSSASTTSAAPSSRAGSNAAGGSPGSRRSCSAASPRSSSGGQTASTSTSRPAPRSSRAATSPSPPLLPLPQTTATRPAGACRAITRARPSPARSIRSSDGMPAPRSPSDRWRASSGLVEQRLEPARRAHSATATAAGHAVLVRQRHRDRRPELLRAGRAPRRTAAPRAARPRRRSPRRRARLHSRSCSALATASLAQNRAARCMTGRARVAA